MGGGDRGEVSFGEDVVDVSGVIEGERAGDAGRVDGEFEMFGEDGADFEHPGVLGEGGPVGDGAGGLRSWTEGVHVGEGGVGVGEEHDAEAGDEEVEGGGREGGVGGVGDDELGGGMEWDGAGELGAAGGFADEVGGDVEAGDGASGGDALGDVEGHAA